MSVLPRLTEAVEQHPHAKALVLSPRIYYQAIRECFAMCRYEANPPTSGFEFMGLPVHRYRPVGFCRNCGAESEPVRCSYCRSPSDFVEVL